MITTRFRFFWVGALLAGVACSSSDDVKDAAPVPDARVDGPAVREVAIDQVVADSPLLVADTSPVDVNVPDVPATGVDATVTEVAAAETGVACTGEYLACGCGCCGEGIDGGAMKTACYYPSEGATVSTVAAWDEVWRSQPSCKLTGCSAGIRELCCPELPPEPAGAASYTAEWIFQLGTPILQVTKSGADCATVWFLMPGENYTSIRTPLGWGVSLPGVGACGEAGVGTEGIGGVGTFTTTLQPVDSICTNARVSLHATLFALDGTGAVKAVRLDADDLFLKAPQPSVCPQPGP